MLNRNVLLASITAVTLAGSASATLIAYEPFLGGSNRANNEYGPTAGDIRSYGVTNGLGLVDSISGGANAWAGSTSNYQFDPVGYGDTDVPYTDGNGATAATAPQGSLKWLGTTSSPNFLRQVNRGLQPYTGSSTYYMSAIMRRGNWGSNLNDITVGFTNGASANTALEGVFFGFQGNRQDGAGEFPSLVLKAGGVTMPGSPSTGPSTAALDTVISGTGSTFGRTYTIVVKVDVNPTGNETITWWVDNDVTTTNWLTEATATSTATFTGSASVEAMSSLTSINRIGVFSPSTSGAVNFDEIRFGTTLEAVTGVVPEPGTLGLAALGLAMLAKRRR